MSEIRFTVGAVRSDGEKLYDLTVDGRMVAEGLTIDEVICRINRADADELGEQHISVPEELRRPWKRR